jgi:hypothetical protein
MKTLANAHSSKIVGTLKQQSPLKRASSMGDSRFISFISLQAALPNRAALVVSSLEEEIQKGYRLDEVLTGILNKAKATVRMFPHAPAIH